MFKDDFTENFEVEDPKIMADIAEHMGDNLNEKEININDYIAILTILSKSKLSGEPQENNKSIEIENAIKIYAYLRDKFNAQTGNEALNVLMNKKIDEKVIKFWIDEDMADAEILFAIEMGYPGLIEKSKKE